MLRVILILSIVLLTGCAARINGDYCDIAQPMYFESADTINWLADNDRPLLTRIVTHNEVTAALCRG